MAWVNLIYAIWDISRDPVTGRPTSATMQAGFPKAGNSIFAGFGVEMQMGLGAQLQTNR